MSDVFRRLLRNYDIVVLFHDKYTSVSINIKLD